MGYESKIYFVREYNFPENGIHHSGIVAVLDMSKMGYTKQTEAFLKCFDTETPFSLYLNGYDEKNGIECLVDTIKDCYGARLKYASDKEHLYECSIEMEKSDNYWLFPILRRMIDSFRNEDDIKIVHYGY